MHWPQYVTLITWWAGMLISGGRYAWHHWHTPRPPEITPEKPPAAPMPDYYDYIEDRYRDQ